MKGSAYLIILPVLLLLSASFFLGIVGENIYILGEAPWKRSLFEVRAKNSLLTRWKHWLKNPDNPLYESTRFREGYTLKEKFLILKEGNILLLGRAVFARGNVPLSLFPDILLESFPSSESILTSFFGKWKLKEISHPFYSIEGILKGIYVKGNASMFGVDEKIRIYSGNQAFQTQAKIVVVEGTCKARGILQVSLICAGRISAESISRSSSLILISCGQGLLEEEFYGSEVVIQKTPLLKGEILAKRVVLKGRGTLQGGIQAMEVKGDWKLKRKGREIIHYPRLFFPEETFAYSEKTFVELE